MPPTRRRRCWPPCARSTSRSRCGNDRTIMSHGCAVIMYRDGVVNDIADNKQHARSACLVGCTPASAALRARWCPEDDKMPFRGCGCGSPGRSHCAGGHLRHQRPELHRPARSAHLMRREAAGVLAGCGLRTADCGLRTAGGGRRAAGGRGRLLAQMPRSGRSRRQCGSVISGSSVAEAAGARMMGPKPKF